jgi:RepB DNA-primase from phage plasmid
MQEQHDFPIPHEGQHHPEASDDLSRLPSLWDAVYGEQQGYVALLSGLRTDRRLAEIRERFFPFPAAATSAVNWVRREAARGRELYQCGHLVVRPRRRKEDAAWLASLYADIDHRDLAAGMLEPTLLVESSPGRLQAYWRLTRPVSPAVGEELNRRLAQALEADPSGWDLTQLLRVPGTRNHKYAEAPLVRVLSQSMVRYDASVFAVQLPQVSDRQAAPRPPRRAIELSSTAATAPPVQLSRPAQAVWNGEDVKYTVAGVVDRSASLLRIARVLYEAGMAPSAIVAVLAERDASLGWEKYSGRRDAEAQYQAIVQFVQHGARTRRRRQ